MRSRVCLFVFFLCLLCSTLLFAADSPYRLRFQDGAATVYAFTVRVRQERYVLNPDEKGMLGRTLSGARDWTVACTVTLKCSRATDAVSVFDATLELQRFTIEDNDGKRVDYHRESHAPGKRLAEHLKALHAVKDIPLEISITPNGRLAKLKGLPKLCQATFGKIPSGDASDALVAAKGVEFFDAAVWEPLFDMLLGPYRYRMDKRFQHPVTLPGDFYRFAFNGFPLEYANPHPAEAGDGKTLELQAALINDPAAMWERPGNVENAGAVKGTATLLHDLEARQIRRHVIHLEARHPHEELRDNTAHHMEDDVTIDLTLERK